MSGKQRNIRKSKVILEEDEDEDAIDASKLEDIKLQQKSRKRIMGLDTVSLATTDAVGTDVGLSVSDSELMETYVKEKPMAGMASTDENPHMQQYVEEEVQRRMGRVVEVTEDPAAAKRRRVEEALYDVPEMLKGARPTEVVIPGLITGITEVVLPLESRLKNIEETEVVKRRLLSTASRDTPGSDSYFEQKPQEEGLRRGMFASSFGRNQHKKRDPDAEGPTRTIRAPRESRLR